MNVLVIQTPIALQETKTKLFRLTRLITFSNVLCDYSRLMRPTVHTKNCSLSVKTVTNKPPPSTPINRATAYLLGRKQATPSINLPTNKPTSIDLPQTSHPPLICPETSHPSLSCLQCLPPFCDYEWIIPNCRQKTSHSHKSSHLQRSHRPFTCPQTSHALHWFAHRQAIPNYVNVKYCIKRKSIVFATNDESKNIYWNCLTLRFLYPPNWHDRSFATILSFKNSIQREQMIVCD